MKKNVLLAFVLVLLSTALVVRFIGPTVGLTNQSNGSYGDGKFSLASSKTIWVPDNFTSIQEAINNASDGDTIFVRADTYYGYVVVNKTISLIGEDKYNTIIDGSENGTVVTIALENVSLSGFTIRNSGFPPGGGPMPPLYKYCGVACLSNGCNISGNIVLNNFYGIILINSSEAVIAQNEISNNHVFGLSLAISSSKNNVSENTIVNSWIGFTLEYSKYNILRDNTIANNTRNFGVGGASISEFIHDIDASNTVNGKPICYWINQKNEQITSDAGYIGLVNCTDITVKGIKLENNWNGLMLANTNNTYVTRVNSSNNNCGIELWHSNGNRITGCYMINNTCGMFLQENSSSNHITTNNFKNNEVGLIMFHSYDNEVYHNNFIGNLEQAFVHTRANSWDREYPAGGNYWSDHDSKDLDNDGIGDETYFLGHHIEEDIYPLMGMFSSFNTSLGYQVNVISNSTIEDFEYFESNSTIKMYVSNSSATQSFGFCRVCIPKDLMSPPYTVIINDGLTGVLHFNGTVYDNDTHMWIYFAYEHSTHKVEIIPEFPTLTSTLLILIVLTVSITIYKRKLLKTPIH